MKLSYAQIQNIRQINHDLKSDYNALIDFIEPYIRSEPVISEHWGSFSSLDSLLDDVIHKGELNHWDEINQSDITIEEMRLIQRGWIEYKCDKKMRGHKIYIITGDNFGHVSNSPIPYKGGIFVWENNKELIIKWDNISYTVFSYEVGFAKIAE